MLWYQNEFALGDKIYLFFCFHSPAPYSTFFVGPISLQKYFQTLPFAFNPCTDLDELMMNWWWIQPSADFHALPLLFSVTHGCLSSAAIHLLMLLSSSNIFLISVSLFMSWAFVPPAHFPLHLFYLSKSFLHLSPSDSWSSYPVSLSFSSHPCA